MLQFLVLDDVSAADQPDPAAIVLTCANCGARMDESSRTLACQCGSFASCSDHY